MMKGLLFFVMALMVPGFFGCSSIVDDGRMQATKDIRLAEEKTKQEVLITRQAEINAGKVSDARRNPTVKTTAYDDQGKVVAVTEVDLQPALAELGLNKGKGETYGVQLTTTPIPKGQAAETIEATTGLIAEAGRAPGTIVYATAKGVASGIKEAGGGVNINGETVNLDESFNRSEAVAIGEGNSVSGALTNDKSQKSELSTQGSLGVAQ